jgi:hypothetical protein
VHRQVFATAVSRFRTCTLFTFRIVFAPGVGTMSVVAAVVINACVDPGVTTPVLVLRSTHDARTSMFRAEPVMSWSLSLVVERKITCIPRR